MLHEWRSREAIFDLPKRRFWRPKPGLDLSVPFHGERAECAAGPAAGPQSQLAQNIILSWLAGGRVIELKTVQIDDHLELPRPCIDARTIGYNVEWSQELQVEESLEEYVKAWMLLHILREELRESFCELALPLFDMSVGYDLAGIRSAKVGRFIRGLMDATPTIDRLRAELRGPFAAYAAMDFSPRIADCITLSTFHGCPPSEIESICEYLLRELETHVVVKMNPTQLGYEEVDGLLRGRLGYEGLELDPEAFAHDLNWDQAQGLIERLDAVAQSVGRTVGVKYSNTLVVKNRDEFFSEPTMYLSGAPLHVLAIRLAARFRDRFGGRFGVSFSAGIDRVNFAEAVLGGLAPVTSCTDLLRAGGYGRMQGYLRALEKRLGELGAGTVAEGIIAIAARVDAAGLIAAVTVDEAQQAALGGILAAGVGGLQGRLESAGLAELTAGLEAEAGRRNLHDYAARVADDPRYSAAKNSKLPRKIGRKLVLFDCISCDKCVQVCPNDANFFIETAQLEVSSPIYELEKGAVVVAEHEDYRVEGSHQLANYADFCNECGNCDVFCPEDGGPYIIKPRFFENRASFLESPGHDGFVVEAAGGALSMLGRIGGQVHQLSRSEGEPDRFDDGMIALELDPKDSSLSSARPFFRAKEGHRLPLWRYHAMRLLLDAVLADGGANPVSAAVVAQRCGAL